MDKVLKKQLEAFGTEAQVLVEGSLEKKRQLEFAEVNRSVVAALMDTIEGRQWMFSKLDMTGVFTAPWVGEKPLTNAYMTGIQSVGHNFLQDIMTSAPDKYFLMVQEEEARKVAKV